MVSAALTSSVASWPCVTTTTPIIALPPHVAMPDLGRDALEIRQLALQRFGDVDRAVRPPVQPIADRSGSSSLRAT